MSDDIRDYCKCTDCQKARQQIYFHTARNRRVRESMEKQYQDLLNSTQTPQTQGKCGGTRVIGNGGSMNYGEFVTQPCPGCEDCTARAPAAEQRSERIETMDIYSPAGTKVVFAYPTHGYPGEIETAQLTLVPGRTYTVQDTQVGQSYTSVALVEKPGQRFNSCMFAPTAQPAAERECTCHPDDNPPRPCPRKYALHDCRAAAEREGLRLPYCENDPDVCRCAECTSRRSAISPTPAPSTAPGNEHGGMTEEQREALQAGAKALCWVNFKGHSNEEKTGLSHAAILRALANGGK